MKRLVFLLFLSLAFVSAKSQNKDIAIIGNWKMVKIQFSKNVVFDLNDLTTSYKQFFSRQKETYKNKLSTNDSLFIQYNFEKAVNDISRMFINFKTGNVVETNGFDKDGSPSEKKITGNYRLSNTKNDIFTFFNGSKKYSIKYKIVSVDNHSLQLNDSKQTNPLMLTFRKVVK